MLPYGAKRPVRRGKMDYETAKKKVAAAGQSHLLEYYGELDVDERRQLLNDIARIDFSVLGNIGKRDIPLTGKISPITAASAEEIRAKKELYEREGLRLLRGNKVGAVLLAGGQGTRLGSDKPKGMFDIGVTRSLSIFGQQMNNIKEVTEKAGAYFPLFVMTGEKNDKETRDFFKDNDYFGYPAEKIHFYIQETRPACSFDGKIFLEKKYRVSMSPNGNGGWYSSLVGNGLRSVLQSEGVEWLNVYAVDNVLQRICDPAFIGATYLSGKNCSAKVVRKVNADEKVGVLCNIDGKPAVVEYYEIPEELKNLRNENGELVYCYGVILNYLFRVDMLDKILSDELPYHIAEKAVPHIENGVTVNPDKPNGCKFETLVVDMIKNMGSCLAYEVIREHEFAPVKNRTGADSVETARELLRLNGVEL